MDDIKDVRMIYRYIYKQYTFHGFAQVSGQSYLLWAIENYANMCNLADDLATKVKSKAVVKSSFAVNWMTEKKTTFLEFFLAFFISNLG